MLGILKENVLGYDGSRPPLKYREDMEPVGDMTSCSEKYSTRDDCEGQYIGRQGAYVEWLFMEYGHDVVAVDLPRMWFGGEFSKSQVYEENDGWRDGFKAVIGKTPEESYAQFNTWQLTATGIKPLKEWYLEDGLMASAILGESLCGVDDDKENGSEGVEWGLLTGGCAATVICCCFVVWYFNKKNKQAGITKAVNVQVK